MLGDDLFCGVSLCGGHVYVSWGVSLSGVGQVCIL